MSVEEAEIICLSSDDEVEEVEKKEIAEMRYDLKQIKSFTSNSKIKASAPTMYNIPGPGAPKTNGEEHNKISPETVDLDEDSDLEVEYCGNLERQDVKETPNNLNASDDDDEIEFLDEYESSTGPVIVGVSGLEPSTSTVEGTVSQDDDAEEEVGSSNQFELEVEGEDVEAEEEGDEIDELEEEITQEACAQITKRDLQNIITELKGRKHRDVTPKKLEKLKVKFDEAFDKIRHLSVPVHKRLQEEIEDIKRKIIVTGKVWTFILQLLTIMKPDKAAELILDSEEVRKLKKNKELLRLTQDYEKQLLKIRDRIQKLEEQEVDWDDEVEHNSQYIMEDKYKKKLVGLYYQLCDLTKCSRMTGRPIQNRINLKKQNAHSGYEKIDSEVEKFVNKGGFLFIPDFTDINSIVMKVNEDENLGLNSDVAFELAKKLFSKIVAVIKNRRAKDFKMTMLSLLPRSSNVADSTTGGNTSGESNGKGNLTDDEEDYQTRFVDPADRDPELEAKLKENESLKKSESEIIDKFAKEAEAQKSEASCNGQANSDNEEENEEEDEDDEEDTNEKARREQIEQEELTEDEDVELETVGNCWPSGITLKETEDLDGKQTTDCESEVEANASFAVVGSAVNGDVEESDSSAEDKVQELQNQKTDLKRSNSIVNENDEDISPPMKKARSADENSNEEIKTPNESNACTKNDPDIPEESTT